MTAPEDGPPGESSTSPPSTPQDIGAIIKRAEESTIPAFDAALNSNSVSLAHLSNVYESMRSEDEFTRRLYANYLPKLTKAFESKYGPISDSAFYPAGRAAAALAKDDQLYLTYSPQQKGVTKTTEEMLWEIESLNREMRSTLEGAERKVLSSRLYSLACLVFSTIETKSLTPDSDVEDKVDFATEELGRIRKTYATVALRDAQFRYLRGLLWGTIVLWISLIASEVIFSLISADTADPKVWQLMISSALSGSFGADVSVLSRITFGKLNVNYLTGDKMLRLLGAFRPVIGAILGLSLFALIYGTILPLEYPSNPKEMTLFFAGVGFLAGFSERWAQDMLGGVAGRLGKTSGLEGTTPPGK